MWTESAVAELSDKKKALDLGEKKILNTCVSESETVRLRI